MANTIISPNRYVQGRGELKNLPEHAKKLGKKLFVIISASGLKRVRDLLEKSFENTGMELVFEEFQGECCETEIKRLGSRFQENKCDLVVGVGGGKIHDSKSRRVLSGRACCDYSYYRVYRRSLLSVVGDLL